MGRTSKIFLIEGHHSIDKFIEIGTTAHISTSTSTLALRECIHSNSFLVSPVKSTNSFWPVSSIFETSHVNYEHVLESLNEQSLFPISSSLIFANLSEILLDSEIRVFASRFKLITNETENGILVARIDTKSIIKIIQYIQSLSCVDEFALFKEEEYGKVIERWAINSFKGSSAELGYFIALQKIEELKDGKSGLETARRDIANRFIEEWRSKDLHEPDLDGLRRLVYEKTPTKADKMIIQSILSNYT